MSSLIRFHYGPAVAFDRLFDDTFNARTWACPASAYAGRLATPTEQSDLFRPRMDLQESKDANIVTATFELPGLTRDDVTIDVHENRLTVSGTSASSRSDERDGYVVRERRSGTFSRTLQLPLGIKPEDVKAKLDDGILTVTFPKTADEQGAQRIAIEA